MGFRTPVSENPKTPDSLSSTAMPAKNSRGRSARAFAGQKIGGQTLDVAAGGQRKCLMTLPLPGDEGTRVRAGDDHGHRAPGLGPAAGSSAPLPRRALDGPQLRSGLLISADGMAEVPCDDPRAGRASGAPDCLTLVLVAWRETPHFRQWRKC